MSYGVPLNEDFNRGDNFGCGYFDVNQHEGVRWSAADAFLSTDVRERSNLTILTHSHVDRLILTEEKKPRAVGCLIQKGDDRIEI